MLAYGAMHSKELWFQTEETTLDYPINKPPNSEASKDDFEREPLCTIPFLTNTSKICLNTRPAQISCSAFDGVQNSMNYARKRLDGYKLNTFFTKPPIPFLDHYANPCWNEEGSVRYRS